MPRNGEPLIPPLLPLRYLRDEGVRCEDCGDELNVGMRVSWWKVPSGQGTRTTCRCAGCHRARAKLIVHGRSTTRRRRPKGTTR
jgi:hypothetical protein